MEHFINPRLASDKAVDCVVVGAGGTGSQVITALAQVQHALVALGHAGLNVTVVDDDIVSEANVGRQWFFPADVGKSKAEVLVQRVNLTLGTDWHAEPVRLTASHKLGHPLVIGCVDTRVARFNIMRAMEEGSMGPAYYLDFGNRQYSGQVVLGEVTRARRKTNQASKLPHVGELFPEVMDSAVVDPDEGPSCSLADALRKQSLFINRALVAHGMAMLWELLHTGRIDYHGVFVNLKSGRTTSLPVDPNVWAKYGYGKSKTRIRRCGRKPERATA
ncbi:MAG: PRTRC system ThiF family protein [Burkholderiales bacterium]|nr:PRTRC system ThiF family protein [Burkholderiales bacterium]